MQQRRCLTGRVIPGRKDVLVAAADVDEDVGRAGTRRRRGSVDEVRDRLANSGRRR